MKTWFFDAEQRLRNGWWVLIFIACIAATRIVYTPLVRGLKAAGVHELWLEPMGFLFTLLATWVCLRLRREPLSSVGYSLDSRWWKEIAIGIALGGGSILLVAGLIWLVGGVQFTLDPARSASTMLIGLYVFLFVALFEENLYRGFLFQRLVAGIGVWPTQILLAFLFSSGHWGNPDMQGMAMIVATVELALASILMGLAYLRTRSLALPIGIHLSWNWVQGQLLGFDVSGYEQAGWLQPVLQDRPAWITGGAFGPEASVFAIVADLMLIALLWRWKGSSRLQREEAVASMPIRIGATAY